LDSTLYSRESVGIKVNDDIGHYFQTLKGLGQGDPFSPILFHIVAGMLAILIAREKEDRQIDNLVPHLVDGGISILQYADDTILFMEHDLAKAVNMKLILYFFIWFEIRENFFNKYLGSKTLSQVQVKPTDSPFWKGIMRVKDEAGFDTLQTYLSFLMLHACFTPINLCFVYTSWYFYAFSRTNLLTRFHSASSYFLLFFVI
jgi:hypothetical protein